MVDNTTCFLAMWVAMCLGIIFGVLAVLPKKDTPTTADSAVASLLLCQDGKIHMYEDSVFICVAFCPNFKGQGR